MAKLDHIKYDMKWLLFLGLRLIISVQNQFVHPKKKQNNVFGHQYKMFFISLKIFKNRNAIYTYLVIKQRKYKMITRNPKI